MCWWMATHMCILAEQIGFRGLLVTNKLKDRHEAKEADGLEAIELEEDSGA